jgi:D-serine deaminase-like pyridoxal phosphate-dependent protein
MEQAPERPPRVAVIQSAVLTTANGLEQHVAITDISARGFQIEGHEGLKVGDQVYLRIGKQGNVAAEIRWTAETKAGGVFFDGPGI